MITISSSDRYETHHHVRIKDEAIIAAVELSSRYITDRFLPDKAIDLIDESAAKLRLEMNSMPEELDTLERQIRQLEIEREAIKSLVTTGFSRLGSIVLGQWDFPGRVWKYFHNYQLDLCFKYSLL